MITYTKYRLCFGYRKSQTHNYTSKRHGWRVYKTQIQQSNKCTILSISLYVYVTSKYD